jgi:hypothetical protein
VTSVSGLSLGSSLSIRKGGEVIVWVKKADPVSLFKFRRMHYLNGKLLRVTDNKKLGTADDEELNIRLSEGFQVA